jgi:CheY-like chemotaxis protein
LKLVSEIQSDLPDTLIGDPVRLQQIVINLVGNAIKFTEEGEISIRVHLKTQKDDQVVLQVAVSDTGIGIPEEKQAQIFQAFSQADSSTTRLYGGTGLGLSICAYLVSVMGGKIWVESEYGKGSTFHFTAQFDVQECNEPSTSIQLVDAQTAYQPLHLLLAEDNIVNQRLAVRLLEKQGHRVAVVGDGRDAVEVLEDMDFDLILMDVQMPNMDGLEATRAIRERGLSIPIVAMTAHAMKGDRERCLAAGMDEYISKPIKAADLQAVIERAMSASVGVVSTALF